MLKFVSWPVKTPTGDRLREWLKECGDDAATRTVDGAESPTVNQAAGAA